MPDADRVVTWLRSGAQFLRVKVGGESFYIAQVPKLIQDRLCRVVAEVIDAEILSHTLIVGRCSTETIDSGIRIHSDYDMHCTHAWVWYGTDPPDGPIPFGGELYGTAMYDHVELGPQFTGSLETHNSLLRDESQDESRWKFRTMVPMRKNRVAVYPSSLFHSRFPHEGWGTSQRDGRITIVGFCTAKGYDVTAMDSGSDQETGSPPKEPRD
jgi:hypothetical protein